MSKWKTKSTKWHVRPVKTQISLSIRPVWSESLLCAQWIAKDPMFPHADSEDSNQTGWIPRLIWVFAGRTCHFVGFVVLRLICTQKLVCWAIYNLISTLFTEASFEHVNGRLINTKTVIILLVMQTFWHRSPNQIYLPLMMKRNEIAELAEVWVSRRDEEINVYFQLSHVMRKPVYAICEKQRRWSACASAVWSAPLLVAA